MRQADPDPARDLVAVGIRQRDAGATLADALFVSELDPKPLLAHIEARGLRDVLVLATCERIEVIALGADSGRIGDVLQSALSTRLPVDRATLARSARSLEGEAALRHLFALAASLESEVVGDPQILGQLKAAHRAARAAGLIGADLETTLQSAYAAARRVRRETRIGEQAVTIATSMLSVSRDVHGDLRRRSGLLIGLGEMGEFLATELHSAGVRDLVICHPSPARAQASARRLGCHHRPWAERGAAIAGADIVISANGGGDFIVTAEHAKAALKHRRQEPIFFVDAAIPGDIDPAVADLGGAFVYTLDDLERVAETGRATRASECAAAWAILDQQLAVFAAHRAARAAVPSVAALRQHFEAVREDVLEDGRLNAEEATRRLVNRLLHTPQTVLREAAAGEPEETSDDSPGEEAPAVTRSLLEAALRRLFGIGAPVRHRAPEEEES